ncbi:MAG: beta-1,6-N-acetylglucosaminyltransferase [Akkermansiaceae bacterium]
MKDKRGQESSQRYACNLTHRLAIREAKRRKAPAVLILEDDVVFCEDFIKRCEALDLPDDWDVLFFGCTHTKRPTAVGPSLAKAHENFDNHCYAVNATAYDRILAEFASPPKGSEQTSFPNDIALSNLLGELNGYACFPNLAWQAVSSSEILGFTYSNYSAEGSSVYREHITRGLAAETLGIKAWKPELPPIPKDEEPQITGCSHPKVALLFLTQGDLNRSDIWECYLEERTEQAKLFVHAKHPDNLTQKILRQNLIPSHTPTNWGDISLVKATLALLEEALKDPEITHCLLLSESCIPTKPFSSLVDFLKVDSRSWISYETPEQIACHDLKKSRRLDSLEKIPKQFRYFQNQWMLLEREIAEAVVENNLTHLFDEIFAPDESYFITLLLLMGYPHERIINDRITWSKWDSETGHPRSYSDPQGEDWSEALRASGFFARKFTSINER